MIRLFTALPMDSAIAERLAILESGIPGARWVEPRNLHVTLRFIGEVDEATAEEIHHALSAITAPRFTLTLEGFGTFGSRNPRILWAGVVRDPAMNRLQEKIETALIRCGLSPESRRFQPHVTLASLNKPPVPRLQAFIFDNSPFRAGPVPVPHFTLFRSHLSRNGAEYEVLAEYPLG
jgi:RNA 2',3'-cyclic 3'-phosphodiesterase